jgi:hypothetical protein
MVGVTRHGLNAYLVLAHKTAGLVMVMSDQAQVLHYALEQVMQATLREPCLAFISSPMNSGVFALVASRKVASIQDVKGKLLGIGQIGDASYGYSVALFDRSDLSPRDVQWIPFGTDPNNRIAGLVSERVDVISATAPSYFRVLGPDFRIPATFAERKGRNDPMWKSANWALSLVYSRKNKIALIYSAIARWNVNT